MLGKMVQILPVRIPADILLRLSRVDGFLDSEEDKLKWREDTESYRQYRKMVESELNQRYKTVLRDSQESHQANEVSIPSVSPSASINKVP